VLEKLTLGAFTPHVGSVFRVDLPGVPAVELTLTEAASLDPKTAAPKAPREPFVLRFRGAGSILPQRIYPLESPLGRLEIFLVPVGKTEAGVEYEAIFN
jgi:Domain of unknown function (DUF6916)